MLAITGASTDSVTFAGSPGILSLDSPSTFNGQIIGFTGDGSLAGSDQIDLRGMDWARLVRDHPKFGQITISNFNPGADTIKISQSIFTNVTALLEATHDDAHGNAVITATAHDTNTLEHVTTAQLLLHQGDFHFI
jgi:hypothetical protein